MKYTEKIDIICKYCLGEISINVYTPTNGGMVKIGIICLDCETFTRIDE